MTYEQRYEDCLHYIDEYWDKITFQPTRRRKIKKHFITIPYTYITPNDKKFNYIFYWDTYFMFRGITGTKREWILKEMVNNFKYLYETYGIIPNLNAPFSMGRSQPPFLSSMILDTYNTSLHAQGLAARVMDAFSVLIHKATVSRKWLADVFKIAKDEYNHVWMDEDGTHHHRVKGYLLNRYGDSDIGYAHSSELESGWDFTSRFYNRCNHFLAVDLNSYLYMYEKNFARIATILENNEESKKWKEASEKRKEAVNAYFWNEKKGFFFDYDYRSKIQSEFLSLAGFTPLWAGIASKKQAEKMVRQLRYFETESGLTITSKGSLAPTVNLQVIPKAYRYAVEYDLFPKQWDYPYIWPPIEYLAVIGLLRYGFTKEAYRIMKNSLETHAKLFRRYGVFFEKINAMTGEKPEDFHYPSQVGFGWTNAIFYRYVKLLDATKTNTLLDKTKKEPPYDLSVLH